MNNVIPQNLRHKVSGFPCYSPFGMNGISRSVKRGLLLMLLACSAAESHAQVTARWREKTTDWSANPHPVIGDWGFNRPGYPEGLYVHGVTVRQGKKVKNAVIYDNDVLDDVFEDEWMFCMASLGLMNLKALIVTPVLTDGWGFYHPDWIATWEEACRLAAVSGMEHIPPVTVGTEAESEKAGERKPSEAARLYVEIINDEYSKHPERPVIVNIGGQGATLASAYCLDPSIAEKCIVYYTDLKVYNGHYEWASKLVARHFRVINWGADEHWWKGKKGQNQWNVLPRPENRLGRDNADDSGEWKLLHDMRQPLLDNMIRGFQNRHEYAEMFGDSYADGTFMHAWLPSIFTDADIQELRGEGTEGIHVTGFDEACEHRVKQFALSILLNPRAYGKKTR